VRDHALGKSAARAGAADAATKRRSEAEPNSGHGVVVGGTAALPPLSWPDPADIDKKPRNISPGLFVERDFLCAIAPLLERDVLCAIASLLERDFYALSLRT